MTIELTTEEHNALFHACTARLNQLSESQPSTAAMRESISGERNALSQIMDQLTRRRWGFPPRRIAGEQAE